MLRVLATGCGQSAKSSVCPKASGLGRFAVVRLQGRPDSSALYDRSGTTQGTSGGAYFGYVRLDRSPAGSFRCPTGVNRLCTVAPHHQPPVRCHSTGVRRGCARLRPVEDSQPAGDEAGGGGGRGLHAPKPATVPEEVGGWRAPTAAAGEGRARKTFHSSAGRAGTGALAARHVRSCDKEAWWAGTREMTDVGVATGAATAEERAHCVFGRAIGVAIAGRLSRRRTAALTALAPWHTPPSPAAAGWWSRPHTDCPGRCHAPDTAVEPWRAVRDGKQGVLGWLSALSGAFLARWARSNSARSLEVYISIQIGYWPSPHDLWGSTETTGGHLRRRSGPPRDFWGCLSMHRGGNGRADL